MAKQGRPPKLPDEDIAALKPIVEADPTATMDDIRVELERRTGTSAHGQTIEKALSTAGVERRMDGAGVRVETNEEAEPRYGYAEAHHREQQPEQAYPSCLTDAEWQLVSDLFESRGGRGKPPKYPRRLLLDACCYVVRTGCSWRMLPKLFLLW